MSIRRQILNVMSLALCLALGGQPAPALAGAEPADDRAGPVCDPDGGAQVITSPALSVLTLNLAHGRGDGFNQMLQRANTTRRNLAAVAAFLSASGADVVALQEADAVSRWSGRFNHVDYVSARSPYPCRVHARHARKRLYDFGTALLSQVPFTATLEHTFAPSPPTTSKGFVLGEVAWNPDNRLERPITVSIVSVHLDFSRKKVRQAQVREMQAALRTTARPLIILGDFNADWNSDDSALKAIVAQSGLTAHAAGTEGFGTYKSGKRRLDWILISPELEFVTYQVPQVVLSDHRPVQASVRLVERPDRAETGPEPVAQRPGHADAATRNQSLPGQPR